MRVLLVNTSEMIGGAAVATSRLMDALNRNGVKAKMLVAHKQTDALTVAELPSSRRHHWHFLWERLCIFLRLHCRREHLYEIDIANAGTNITRLPEYREADVIHLAWINQGMLSLNDIQTILRSGKPVVWTMHDLWPLASICHYARGCEAFHSQCRHCPLLPDGGSDHDLSARVWRKKARTYQTAHITFVACSRWLEGQAKQSALLGRHTVTNIPNPIDTRIFRPQDKAAAREALGLPKDKKIILFVSQKVTNERKGIHHLLHALNQLAAAHPEYKEQWAVAFLGGHSEELAPLFTLPGYPLGYVSDARRIAQVYSAADLFVTPSLEDNLPNTIMEAMACGVPCVGFKVGGIPEMIDHLKTGYVARYQDEDDLAQGIEWALTQADGQTLGHNAVQKVAQRYSQQAVTMRYLDIYTQAMALKQYKL